MRLYSLVDLTGNLIMIEKLVLGGTGTRDLPILGLDALTSAPSRQAWDTTSQTHTRTRASNLLHHKWMQIPLGHSNDCPKIKGKFLIKEITCRRQDLNFLTF